MVYEYWVSTEEKDNDSSPHLEQETAELIETLVCSNKQQKLAKTSKQKIRTIDNLAY